ncbi:hypothetical protein GUJ93_ZPchr0006g46416 [Zizania palustris]|uniref:CCT domain-containing protein n=1 Tax=Zizania palustris TaxID=103762 RepID=A0A8J5W3K8_ZIZPA|nr:hypothetical protein GUJ93_ZPchr0006g46416 [Zizania palustris]
MLPDDYCITEGISNPIAAQILDFCDDGLGDDLFAAVATTSEPLAASSEDGSSSSTATPPPSSYSNEITAAAATAFSPLLSFDSTLLSALLEQEQNPNQDTELLPPIDDGTFTSPAYYPDASEANVEQFSQIQVPEHTAEAVPPVQMSTTATALMSLASEYDDECLTAALAGGYMGLDGTLYQQTGVMIPSCNVETPQVGFFNHNNTSNNSMVVMDMNNISGYQRMIEDGLTRTYSNTDSMQGAFTNAAEMQIRENNQHMISGCNESAPTLPSTEGSSLEDSPYKGVRLTAEQRKEKIHRYIKKRNERNFSKKIKYACRKTLADSRPRVRGRFAKNEELCEATRLSSPNHEHYEQITGMKGEDMLDSSEFVAHLSGMNSYSYKCNCTVESWI